MTTQKLLAIDWPGNRRTIMDPYERQHCMSNLHENHAEPVFVTPSLRTHYLKIETFGKADQCTFQAQQLPPQHVQYKRRVREADSNYVVMGAIESPQQPVSFSWRPLARVEEQESRKFQKIPRSGDKTPHLILIDSSRKVAARVNRVYD